VSLSSCLESDHASSLLGVPSIELADRNLAKLPDHMNWSADARMRLPKDNLNHPAVYLRDGRNVRIAALHSDLFRFVASGEAECARFGMAVNEGLEPSELTSDRYAL
jgi:hypothetical protein